MTSRKLLVINPNTNPAVTERVHRAAEACARPSTRLTTINPPVGPFSIETPEQRAEAIPNVLDLLRAGVGDGYDGYVLACFDDIAVAELRNIVSASVISLAEAGIRAAATRYSRFAIVTTVEAAVPTIEALVRHYGVADQCAVQATGMGVSETAAQTLRAERSLVAAAQQCRDRHGAQGIVLGSGALAGRRQQLQAAFGMPVVDGLEAAITHCESARRASMD